MQIRSRQSRFAECGQWLYKTHLGFCPKPSATRRTNSHLFFSFSHRPVLSPFQPSKGNGSCSGGHSALAAHPHQQGSNHHPSGRRWSSDPSHHIHPSVHPSEFRNSSTQQHEARASEQAGMLCRAERQQAAAARKTAKATTAQPPELLSDTGNINHAQTGRCAAVEPLSHGHATAGRW